MARSGKRFGGVKAHASPEQRARMSPAELVKADIERCLQSHVTEVQGIVNDILAEENRGCEEPDDRDMPEPITDDGLTET